MAVLHGENKLAILGLIGGNLKKSNLTLRYDNNNFSYYVNQIVVDKSTNDMAIVLQNFTSSASTTFQNLIDTGKIAIIPLGSRMPYPTLDNPDQNPLYNNANGFGVDSKIEYNGQVWVYISENAEGIPSWVIKEDVVNVSRSFDLIDEYANGTIIIVSNAIGMPNADYSANPIPANLFAKSFKANYIINDSQPVFDILDASGNLINQLPLEYLSSSENPIKNDDDLLLSNNNLEFTNQGDLNDYLSQNSVLKSSINVANGVAGLDSNAKVSMANLPNGIAGGLNYLGLWDASTNSPTIVSGVGVTAGDYYKVSVKGNTNINGITDWNVGDWIIFNGTNYDQIANYEAVNSVNGKLGDVVVTATDVGLGNVNNTSDANKPISTATQTALNLKEDKANKNIANGYAGLDSNSLLSIPQISPSRFLTAGSNITLSENPETKILTISSNGGGVEDQGLKVVSINGNDTTGTGTYSNPYKTVNKALSVLKWNGAVLLQPSSGGVTHNISQIIIPEDSNNPSVIHWNLTLKGDEGATNANRTELTFDNTNTNFISLPDTNVRLNFVDLNCNFHANPTRPLIFGGGGGNVFENVTLAGHTTPLTFDFTNWKNTSNFLYLRNLSLNAFSGNLKFKNLPVGVSNITVYIQGENSTTLSLDTFEINTLNPTATLTIIVDSNIIFNQNSGLMSPNANISVNEIKDLIGFIATSGELLTRNTTGLYILSANIASVGNKGDVVYIIKTGTNTSISGGRVRTYAQCPNDIFNSSTGVTYFKDAGYWATKENTITAGTTAQYYRGDKTFQTLNATAVGLGNVNNTSDANKPISTATQTALNLKENTITAGTTAQYYRGDKTFQTLDKTAVGLSNVDNTSDANKPISTATQTALNLKANITEVAKKLDNTVATFVKQSSTPLAPSTGQLSFYAKTDDKLYYLNSAGVETTVGAGSSDSEAVGTIKAYYGTTAPIGFLLLNGSTYNKSNYQELWNFANANNLVTTNVAQTGLFYHASLNATTFKIPDFRGYFLRGLGGVDPTLGRTLGSIQQDEFRSHNHLYYYPIYGVNGINPALTNTNYVNQPNNNGITADSGGAETRPVNIAVNYIIKFTSAPNGAFVGGLNYKGLWNADTNIPTLPIANAITGDYYKISVAGSTSIDGINEWKVGDWIIYNGTNWDKIDNTETVSSVNGQIGNVVITKSDVGLSNANNTSDANKPISTATQTALNLKEDKANKNIANGYAGLDSNSLLSIPQISPSRFLTAGSNITLSENPETKILTISSNGGGGGDLPSNTLFSFRQKIANINWTINGGSNSFFNFTDEFFTQAVVDEDFNFLTGANPYFTYDSEIQRLLMRSNLINQRIKFKITLRVSYNGGAGSEFAFVLGRPALTLNNSITNTIGVQKATQGQNIQSTQVIKHELILFTTLLPTTEGTDPFQTEGFKLGFFNYSTSTSITITDAQLVIEQIN